MSSKPGRFTESEQLLPNCKSAAVSNNSNTYIQEKLRKLPRIKAAANFDQKMAAAFAIELEKENIRLNQSLLKKHPHIKLPDIVTNLC